MSSSKALLVLAASKYQIPTIQTAKALGYRVITTDNVPSNPGHSLADRSYTVSTIDREQVLKIAQKEAIAGIIAPCTDVAVPTAAYVAKTLGLPGVPLQAAEIACDKAKFRDFLRSLNLPSPKFYLLPKEAKPNPQWFDHCWVLKPVDSSGSKGIFIVSSLEEYEQYQPETFQYTREDKILLEEFIVGHQGTCQGILENGEITLSVVLDRQTAPFPNTTTTGHYVPSILSQSLQSRLLEQLHVVWQALDITDGPFDCDFVATDSDIYLLELSPRMGGNSICRLLKVAIDFDIVTYNVKYACGEMQERPSYIQIHPSGVLLLGAKENGYVNYDCNQLLSLRKETWVHELILDVQPGDEVFPFINGRYRIGEALIRGESRSDIAHKGEVLKQRLMITAIPPN